MTSAYLNRIATAVPPQRRARGLPALRASRSSQEDRRGSLLFRRMAEKGGIDHRYSYLVPANDLDGDVLDAEAFFVRGRFPNTAARMRFFEEHAPTLAAEAVERLLLGG